MFEELFKLISERLKERCSFLNSNSVKIYQQQDLFQGENKGFKPTCVFINYENINYADVSYNQQECNFEIVVRVVVEELDDNYFKAFRQKDSVVKALQHYLNLTRISEQTDINADALYVYTITFSATFIETFDDDYDIPIGGTSGHAWNFEQTLTMDSNNDGIFTGWASSSGIA